MRWKDKRQRRHFISGITTEFAYNLFPSTIPSVSYIAFFTNPNLITDEIAVWWFQLVFPGSGADALIFVIPKVSPIKAARLLSYPVPKNQPV